MARPAGELCHFGVSHPSRSPISGLFLHQREPSEAGAGPTAPQETLNHATAICSSSDDLLYVTYPPVKACPELSAWHRSVPRQAGPRSSGRKSPVTTQNTGQKTACGP